MSHPVNRWPLLVQGSEMHTGYVRGNDWGDVFGFGYGYGNGNGNGNGSGFDYGDGYGFGDGDGDGGLD